MKLEEWRKLGWKDPFWELLRYYCSLRHSQPKAFLKELSGSKPANSKWWDLLGLSDDAAKMIVTYVAEREKLLTKALESLRTEEEAKQFCKAEAIEWGVTQTKNKDHHQSPKTLIATVSAISKKVCADFSVSLDANPQRRCVWCIDNHLHVTARNLDGAIPSVRDPYCYPQNYRPRF